VARSKTVFGLVSLSSRATRRPVLGRGHRQSWHRLTGRIMTHHDPCRPGTEHPTMASTPARFRPLGA
jgi:hypothetical protein